MDMKVEMTGAKGISSPIETEDLEAKAINENSNATNSIFGMQDVEAAGMTEADALKAELDAVKKEQGFLGKIWDKFKNATGLGLGSNDVEDNIKKFENGEISYEEALASIQSFDAKQDGIVDMAANVASGLVVAGSAIVTGGTSLIAGAAIGGAVKAGIKTADRATNEIEGDALDAKQIIKDGVTGAVDGAVTIATAGMVKAPVLGQSVGKAVATGAVQGAKAGVISGAASSAASYTVNAAVEEDVDFKFSELVKTTAQGAAVGGAFGGVLGGATGGLAQAKFNRPEVRQFASKLGFEDGNIHDSEVLNNYLTKNRRLDVDDLNKYIDNIDTDSLYKAAPKVKDYTPEQKMNFYDYHYKSGTTTWDASTLSLPEDFTMFLQKNYMNADDLGELLDKYPMTNREVGSMPQGWLDNIAEGGQEAAQKEIYGAIAKFQASGSSNVDELAADLSRITGKEVKIKELGSGCFGTGYKVSMDGADDACLKIFHQGGADDMLEMQKEMFKMMGMKEDAAAAMVQKRAAEIRNMHGQNVEVQTGLFLNEHSDDFVHMYFGKVAGTGDTDAFLVTQFLDDATTPVSSGHITGGYRIKAKDAWKGDSFMGKIFGGQDHNIINGKIIDYGAVKVKKRFLGGIGA